MIENTRRSLARVSRGFFQHPGALLLPPLVAALILDGLLLPVARWFTPLILAKGEVPLVSLANLAWLASHHPGVLVGLVGELVLVVTLLVALAITTLVGVALARAGRLTAGNWLRAGALALRAQRPASLLVWLPGLVLLVPLANLLFKTPLFLQVRLSAILVDFFPRHAWLLALAWVVTVLLVWLLARLVVAVPGLLTPGEGPRRVLAAAWRGRPAWLALAHLLILLTSLAILAGGINGLLIGLQVLGDRLPAPWPLTISRVILTLIQVVNECLLAAGVAGGTILAWPHGLPVAPGCWDHHRAGPAVLLALLAITVLATNTAVGLLQSARPARPVVISHRGVDQQNGVQNTLPALARTHRQDHPDLVEMDVHETRDRRFVVLHDETLKKLTGHKQAPGQLTLKELTGLTAHENGQAARITSFDDYLTVAERLHQPLLVEVKTSQFDQPGIAARFAARYGRRLARDHDQVHSMNYPLVQELTRRLPGVPVLSVQPYDLGRPIPVAAGYSMEYSSLSPAFVAAAHQRGRLVYAWTVNDPLVMQQMQARRVDGLITDRAGLAKRVLQATSHASLARQLVLILLS